MLIFSESVVAGLITRSSEPALRSGRLAWRR